MIRVEDIISGNQLAGARMIRMVEDREPGAFDLLKYLYPHSGNAFIIGITGSPGVGKSTLIDALIKEFRQYDLKVAVIAVDPTSPYTGGAILGDRLRMQRHASDNNVFIRSMASRGKTGGLSRATRDTAVVLDAMGFNIIIIETVGAGQAQFDLSMVAHSIGIVTIPGAGDSIQAVKAGILETGDLFIVNKCDLPDADTAANQLAAMLEMKPAPANGWMPKIIKTTAKEGVGINETMTAFLSHREFLRDSGLWDATCRRLNRLYLQNLIKEMVIEKAEAKMAESGILQAAIEKMDRQETDPISAASEAVNEIFRAISN